MAAFFGIVLNKNDGPHHHVWNITATGRLKDLKILTHHNDEIVRQEMKNAVHAEIRGPALLSNTRQHGKVDVGVIYKFTF